MSWAFAKCVLLEPATWGLTPIPFLYPPPLHPIAGVRLCSPIALCCQIKQLVLPTRTALAASRMSGDVHGAPPGLGSANPVATGEENPDSSRYNCKLKQQC